jgi:hypothetical protein
MWMKEEDNERGGEVEEGANQKRAGDWLKIATFTRLNRSSEQ